MTEGTMKCEASDYYWGPHPGCREFMTEPEVAPCQEEAEYLVVTVVSEWDGLQGTEQMYTNVFCERHTQELDEGQPDPYVLTESRHML